MLIVILIRLIILLYNQLFLMRKIYGREHQRLSTPFV